VDICGERRENQPLLAGKPHRKIVKRRAAVWIFLNT
jgi:hypothetical protein